MTKKWIICSPVNVAEINNKDFLKINPSGKVFQCEQNGNEYLVFYKNHTYHITGIYFQEVNEPKFSIGEIVVIKGSGKCVQIIEIFWHYQKNEPFYFIVDNGKKSSKRYFGYEFTKQ